MLDAAAALKAAARAPEQGNQAKDFIGEFELANPRSGDGRSASIPLARQESSPLVGQAVWLARATAAHASLPAEVSDPLLRVLATSSDWQFDAFALDEASEGHALSVLGYVLITQQQVPALEIDKIKLAR